MIALVSGATVTMRRYAHTGCFGYLIVPGTGNVPEFGLPWACDNGAFSGFNEPEFLRMLERLEGYLDCMWVASPDVVADAEATLARFKVWAPRLRYMGYRPALVAQDGLIPGDVPWDEIRCLFIGGTTAFKLGPDARTLIREAKRRNVLVHAGRVNSIRRVRYFDALGVDSFDGTALSMYPDVYFSLFAGLLANPQLGLEIQ